MGPQGDRAVYEGGKLPIMAVIIEMRTLVFDIKNILCIVINGCFTAIIDRVSLFFCRMCEVGVQDWQQPFPGATGWFPRAFARRFFSKFSVAFLKEINSLLANAFESLIRFGILRFG